MRYAGEPSVEEILDSIKKVIARDNREMAQETRERRPKSPTPPSQAREPAESGADEDILELSEARQIADEPQESVEQRLSGLTNEKAARSMRESLAALAMMSEPSAQPQIVRSGETSLEGLVREMLRPMLAQWLDEHLPEMVERLVKDEIARIARKQG